MGCRRSYSHLDRGKSFLNIAESRLNCSQSVTRLGRCRRSGRNRCRRRIRPSACGQIQACRVVVAHLREVVRNTPTEAVAGKSPFGQSGQVFSDAGIVPVRLLELRSSVVRGRRLPRPTGRTPFMPRLGSDNSVTRPPWTFIPSHFSIERPDLQFSFALPLSADFMPSKVSQSRSVRHCPTQQPRAHTCESVCPMTRADGHRPHRNDYGNRYRDNGDGSYQVAFLGQGLVPLSQSTVPRHAPQRDPGTALASTCPATDVTLW